MIKDKNLPLDIQGKITHLVEKLRTQDFVNALFFFGSYARNQLKPLSDLDIAILLSGKPTRERIYSLQSSLVGIITDTLSTDEFDLVILNNAPLRLAYNILKDGKLVFVKLEDELIDFREQTVKYYLDFAYYRRQFDRAFLKGIGYHG